MVRHPVGSAVALSEVRAWELLSQDAASRDVAPPSDFKQRPIVV